jgi:hypothetical protein
MADLPTGSSSTGSNSADIFSNPPSDVWVDYPVRKTPEVEAARVLPRNNIGFYSESVPASVPGWREYSPWTETAVVPAGRDPVGWNCDQCYFKYTYDNKKLCNKHRFKIPTGSWRCNSWVVSSAKFSPFVKEQTPFSNDSVLPLVDQLGRYLIDVYSFVNIRPEKEANFANNYHSHTSTSLVPFFVVGPSPFRWRAVGGSYANYIPTDRKSFLPAYKFGSTAVGVGFPMSTEEKPGWVQYDIGVGSSNFTNLRLFPKPQQNLEFTAIGGLEGHVIMYPRSVVETFDKSGYDALPQSIGYRFDFNAFLYSWGETNASTRLPNPAPELIFSTGDDLVSSKPSLIAVGEKSVSININPKIFLADKVSPIPVKREQLAISEVSTGLLGIPRQEKSLNLFEDINRIGVDPSRWIINKKYIFSSVEPRGWYDSYGVRDNPDEQLPSGTLTYQTALSVESDEDNAGVNLVCRCPPSSFPWHTTQGYGQDAWEKARDAWTDTTINFPGFRFVRTGVASMVELLSRQYFAYQPGRITGFTFGVRACSPELVGSDSEVLWGIENDENAMYFRLNAGTFSVTRSRFNRKIASTFKWSTNRLENVDQGSFNGDNLNGFGSSGYVMEWNKVTMFKIEYGWYGGVGARLYVYIPVGNKAAKWVRVHDFGPPQSDNEPNTPADLRNRRWPSLSTPWFRVFYRLISANGRTSDQGPLSLSKYGVSVYMDGGNANSPQITDVFADTKTIVPFNNIPLSSGDTINRLDTFPVLAFKFKRNMKKRLTQDSIADAGQGISATRTETPNYKVIVPKRLHISAEPKVSTSQQNPLKIDLWLGEGVPDYLATKGKTFYYPDLINYSITNPFVNPLNPKEINWPLNSNPWWTLTPPVALSPDWRTDHGANPTDLQIENRYNPTRPDLADNRYRRYLLGNDPGDSSVYLKGGIVSGVNPATDGRFYAMRLFSAGIDGPDTPPNFSSARSPYQYLMNNQIDSLNLFRNGNRLDFRHLDMCLVSDPIFDTYFNFSYDISGPVHVGVYYHKISSSNAAVASNQIADSSNWVGMIESEIASGMWPLFFTPYSLHGSYGLFGENPVDLGGFAHLSQNYDLTKYITDSTPTRLVYNAAQTRILGGASRGGGLDYIVNPKGYAVHFVFLLAPGARVSNPTITTNASSNDAQKYSMRFLGQPDSLYSGASFHTFLSKIYAKSIVGTNVEWPTKLTGQSSYDYIKSLPALSSNANFKWGRPNVTIQTSESSERTPLNFKDYNENSGILIDTESSQKLDTKRFQLQGSFFISTGSIKPFSFDLSNFFSYTGNAVRGPGDYTFVVTARNINSVEGGGVPVEVAASLQCEEG